MDRRLLLSMPLVMAWPRLVTAQAAAADPLAALDERQRRAVDDYLKRQSRPGEGDAAAERWLQADLDGDGQPEGVLQWTFFGPTFAYSGLALFAVAAGAKGWRLVGEARLTGIVDAVSIEGRQIRVDAKTLGPADPRCCPTKAIVERFRWAGGTLRKG